MHLVITRDYNGYLGTVPAVRAFPALSRHLREYQPSIFEVILPYLKIPVNLVASCAGGVKPAIADWMLNRIKTIIQDLALFCPLWKRLIDLGAQFAAHLEYKGLMPV